MKTYQKPMLVVLSLTGNDQLCGTCRDRGGTTLYDDPSGPIAMELDLLVGDGDGTLTREETKNLFGNGECTEGLDRYCKFLAADEGNTLVAWS